MQRPSIASVHSLIGYPGATEPSAPPAPVPGEVELGEVLRKLWRRKGMIVGLMMVLTAIGALDAVMGLSRSVPGGRLSLRVMM